MMVLAGTVVFMGALALAIAVIWASVAPQWQRIMRLAAGNVERVPTSSQQLAVPESRTLVRRWRTAPSVSPARLRVAA